MSPLEMGFGDIDADISGMEKLVDVEKLISRKRAKGAIFSRSNGNQRQISWKKKGGFRLGP